MAYFGSKKTLLIGLKGEKGDTAGSNPNLLINSNFAINQRGENSYNVGGKYTVDRWYLSTNGATVTPTSNGITFVALSNANAYMGQRIENGFEILKGKTITFSICLSNGTKYTQTGTVPTTTPSSTTPIGTAISSGNFSATGCYLNSVGLLYVQIGARQNTSLNIAWCKLEIGDAATPYTPPTIAEELPKCQMYCEVINNAGGQSYKQYGIGGVKGAYESRFIINFKVKKRTAPTMSFSVATTFSILPYETGNIISATNISNTSSNEECALLSVTTGTELTKGYSVQLISSGTQNAQIIADAEIY